MSNDFQKNKLYIITYNANNDDVLKQYFSKIYNAIVEQKDDFIEPIQENFADNSCNLTNEKDVTSFEIDYDEEKGQLLLRFDDADTHSKMSHMMDTIFNELGIELPKCPSLNINGSDLNLN